MAHSAAAFSINAIGITPNADQAERVRTRTLNHAGGDVQLAVGDVSDPTSLEGALEGVDAVFSPAETCRNQVDYPCAVIDQAAKAGVTADRQAVGPRCPGRRTGRLSALARLDRTAPACLHGARRHVQPGFAMTHLLGAADSVRYQGLLFAPAATARIAMIDPA
jgi:hypothetical protein